MDAVAAAWDGDAYVALLSKLVGEAKHLQNGAGATPTEDRAGRHVLDALRPYSTAEGGPLIVRSMSYVEGRGNIVVELKGSDAAAGAVSFVGMHLDVVPANADDWAFPPFELTQEGDELRGRGVTDCLGHVALVTQLMVALAKAKPALRRSVFAVFIANEEHSSTLGIGVDELVKQDEMERLKAGPLFWVDVANSVPCIGTGGVAAWTLRARGKLFHSGLPHLAINAIELANAACAELQRRFYARTPPHEQEKVYGFGNCSSIKPTQVSGQFGSVNQIAGEAVIHGDIRITPFYDVKECMRAIDADVADINANVDKLPTIGPDSKFVLEAEGLRGHLELVWGEGMSRGVACNLSSPGYAAMRDAFEEVTGSCKPMAITGTLPCIADLQDAGFDVQTLGFGLMRTYHALNECAKLSDMATGFRVLAQIIANMDGQPQPETQPSTKRAKH